MKTKLLLPVLAALAVGPASLHAQTAFTYQGKLVDDCCPATGLYDLTFKVFDAAVNGNQIPPAPGGAVSKTAVPVTNGLFSVSLDFGSAPFNGARRWLQIDARTNNATITPVTLLPRTELTPTPYAIYAQKAGMVPAGAITPAMINSSGASAGQTLTFNGSSVTWASGGGSIWSLNGANAYYNAGNVGIGTTTPLAKLNVQGQGTEPGGSMTLSSLSGPWPSHAHIGTYGSWFIRSASEMGAVILQDTGGNVGIGTAQPKSALDVSGVISWGNNTLSTDQGGSIELGDSFLNGAVPYFDFHYGAGAAQDFNIRLINRGDGELSVISKPLILASSVEVARFSASGLAVNGGVSVSGAMTGHVLFGTESALAAINNTAIPSPSQESIGLRVTGNRAIIAHSQSGNRATLGAPQYAVAGTHAASGAYGRLGYGYDAFVGDIRQSFSYGLYAANDSPGAYAYAAGFDGNVNVNGTLSVSGDASVGTLTIRGGADLAEPFQMSEEKIPEGSVVVIDEENPGHLKHATRAYDTRVAGIVSGANGVKPGIALHQEGVIEGGQNVALTGRVYVKVDASFGAIKPGDLLTTSDTPGHAMKVTDRDRAQGAILGKAMTALAEGQGMVLVLVSLQ